MANNPFILPKITTENREINQIQQNIESQVNKALLSATIVGEVKTAFLTEEQFQAIAGKNWVLADGRNVKGSEYHRVTGSITVPDMRSTVARMADHDAGLNPDGNLELGSYQADELDGHTHAVTDPGHTHTLNPNGSGAGIYNAQANNMAAGGAANAGIGSAPTIASNTTGITINSTGGSETRAKSTIVNFFVRIN